MRRDEIVIDVTAEIRLARFERGWQIEKRREVQKGKRRGEVQWHILGYYSDLAQACRALVRGRWDTVMSDAEITELRDVARVVEEAGERVYNAVRGHPGVGG